MLHLTRTAVRTLNLAILCERENPCRNVNTASCMLGISWCRGYATKVSPEHQNFHQTTCAFRTSASLWRARTGGLRLWSGPVGAVASGHNLYSKATLTWHTTYGYTHLGQCSRKSRVCRHTSHSLLNVFLLNTQTCITTTCVFCFFKAWRWRFQQRGNESMKNDFVTIWMIIYVLHARHDMKERRPPCDELPCIIR